MRLSGAGAGLLASGRLSLGQGHRGAVHLETQDGPDGRKVSLTGRWTVENVAALERAIGAAAAAPPATAVLDAAGIEVLDLTGAWLLRSLEGRLAAAGCQVGWVPGRPEQLAFIDEAVEKAPATPPHEREHSRNLVVLPLQTVGWLTIKLRDDLLEHVGMFGAVVTTIGHALASPRRLRLPSIVRHVYETGVTAIPIVALIAFLISVIVAYIGAQQLRQFGGEIFVVDLVTIAVLRELGVLLTAIIVAGRSGSAFAAEIGVMKLNEEVDALRAIGMDPVEVLVTPRILGLAIALPLLTVLADAMGLAGGALLSWALVDITFTQYIERVNESISETTFWVGLVKAPVFAVAIALVGTMRGMQVRGSSRELGRLTTVAVVQSIFLVILFDAIFAVIFMELEI
jgi:phospholipid/cholesterol/gamma-HCH transport system permease protein